MVNVGKYNIHGWYGINILSLVLSIVFVEEQPGFTLSNDCFGVAKIRKIQMQSFLMTVLTDGMGLGGSLL